MTTLANMKTVTTHEAKTHLSRLLAAAEAGEEIIICRGNRPAARLVPLARRARRQRPRVGTRTSGRIAAAPDAFAPLSDDELTEWGL